MAFMERIPSPASDGELVVIRLLRHYCKALDQEGEADCLPGLVELGQSLALPAAGVVALASVFQLTEAVLGRRLRAECCCARWLGGDERAVLRLLEAPMPPMSGAGTPEIPHGLPGALAWAVLSARRVCADLLAVRSHRGDQPAVRAGQARCPFSVAA